MSLTLYQSYLLQRKILHILYTVSQSVLHTNINAAVRLPKDKYLSYYYNILLSSTVS